MSPKSMSRKLIRRCVCGEPSAPPASPARRNFLAGGVAALGLGAAATVAGMPRAVAQAPATKPPAKTSADKPSANKPRIDVHHHFIPQFHIDAMTAPGRRAGGPPPKWSPALSLEDMDKSGIATSVLSIVQPGVWYGNNVEEAR